MKWINHLAIAGAITAVIKPELVPVAVLGSTAPDWLEWAVKTTGRRIKHRAETHYFSVWLAGLLFGLFLWDFHHLIAAFCAGGLSHVLADSLTLQGIPFGWWSDRRFHLFGGRLRTGQPGEYFVTGAIVLLCAVLGWNLHNNHNDFYPFFYDWSALYQQGLIDAAEWKANRWRWL